MLITDLDLTLPFCLSPIFIVIVFKLGASIIPLEEFPIIKSECLGEPLKIIPKRPNMSEHDLNIPENQIFRSAACGDATKFINVIIVISMISHLLSIILELQYLTMFL